MKAPENESKKWDNRYAAARLPEDDEISKEFDEELRGAISELLPDGGHILEAGCGAGRQSLALARLGKYNIDLMDFSQQALDRAQQLFARENLQANLIYGDVFEPAKSHYDLVFNAGVLEHYTFDQQVAFLRAMSSRSRRYVMVLVPNALCYWYWLWRIQKSSEGKWPFGKEVPVTDFSAVFKAAGLELLGQRFMGDRLAERFIRSLAGFDERLRHDILEIHHSPLIPKSQKSYLLAALGSVAIEKEKSPTGWAGVSRSEQNEVAEMRAALADALALRINGEQRLRDLQFEGEKQTRPTQDLEILRRQLAAARGSFSFQLGNLLVKAVREPGRNTILLPYRLARLGILGLRKG